jgi:hypothetical protein
MADKVFIGTPFAMTTNRTILAFELEAGIAQWFRVLPD